MDTGKGFEDLSYTVLLCYANKILDRTRSSQVGAAVKRRPVERERFDVQLPDDPAEAADMVAVRVRQDDQVNSARVEDFHERLDDTVPVLLKPPRRSRHGGDADPAAA